MPEVNTARRQAERTPVFLPATDGRRLFARQRGQRAHRRLLHVALAGLSVAAVAALVADASARLRGAGLVVALPAIALRRLRS